MSGKGSQGAVARPDAEPPGTPDALAVIVIELLDSDGYDAVQLREVARRARMSLSTIYKRYATRDELIVSALTWWMDTYRYAGVPALEAQSADGESLYDELMRVFRPLFEPWEQHPRLLKAYLRARAQPGGEQLIQHGFDMVLPATKAVLARADPVFAQDVETILPGLVYGLLGRVADGAIDVLDLVPALEKAIYWLTRGPETLLRATSSAGLNPSPSRQQHAGRTRQKH